MQQFFLSIEVEEEDWDPLFVVSYKAFEDQPEITALSPGGLSPESRQSNVQRFKKSSFGGADERCYAEIIERRSGDPIAYVSSRVLRVPRKDVDDNPAKRPPPVELPQIKDREEREYYEWYWNAVRAALWDLEEAKVRPVVLIQSLATHPDWQRHGAGSMLMNWTLEWARKEKIGRCVLQASPMAVKTGFYEKFGFRAVKHHFFEDEERFPGRKGASLVSMVRDL